MQKVLDEMSHMEGRLTDTMVGHCGVLEQRIEENEQKMEARFIALEMDHAQLEGCKPDIEKRLYNLNLEMHRANRFMERETMLNDTSSPCILHPWGSATRREHAATSYTGGLDGHHENQHHREHGFGRHQYQTRAPIKGTYQSNP